MVSRTGHNYEIYPAANEIIDEISILYLDDDALDHKLMSLILRRPQDGAPQYKLSCVAEIDAAREALREDAFDIFVLDNRMPRSPNFHATLAKIGAINPSTKIVVVSSEIESDEFRNCTNLHRKPDAVIEKSNLSKSIKSGFLVDLLT